MRFPCPIAGMSVRYSSGSGDFGRTFLRVMLDVQFRMHPSIADFVGRIFYPEGLRSGVTGEDRLLRFAEFTQPICLVPTSAYKNRFEENVGTSFRNCASRQTLSAESSRKPTESSRSRPSSA